MNDATPPVVDLQDVGLTYPGPPAVDALRGVTLSIRRGEYVAITGASGSGKSTLLNVVGLLDRATSGRYALEGVEVSSLTERQRAALRGRRIGFVFQSFHLLPQRSARDNVALAQTYVGVKRRDRERRAEALLERVGLGHRKDAVASQLSGGERQRVAISRALLNEPSLLLCDEPTGNLDTSTAADVLALVRELNADGQTIALITHDLGVAAQADRQLDLRDGRVVT